MYSTALKKQRELGWLTFKRWKKYEEKEYFQVGTQANQQEKEFAFKKEWRRHQNQKLLSLLLVQGLIGTKLSDGDICFMCPDVQEKA